MVATQQIAAVPVTPVDTGLGSLALVLAMLGEAFDINRARREYLSDGRAADCDDLVRIARGAGLKAQLSPTSVERVTALSLPVIARCKDGTFFVIGRRVEADVMVGLGGGPPVRWTMEELERQWTGEIVLFARRDRLPGEVARFGLRWFIPVIKRFSRVLAEVLVISVFIQLVALASPLFFQVVIDKVLVHRGLTTLNVLIIGLLVINLADALLNWLRTYAFAHTTSRMDAILGSQLFRHLVALPISYFESRATGQTVARVRELENVRQFITSSALTLVVDVAFSLLFLAVMFWYSASLTLAVVISIPFYIAISLVITPILKARVQEKFQRGAANQSLLVESLTGIQTLKACAVEPQMRRRWDEQLAAYIGSSLRVVTMGAAGSQLVGLVNKVTSAAILWFGAQAVIANQLTIGEFVAFNMLAGQISAPVLRLAQLWQDFQQFRLSIERIADIIDTPTEPNVSAKQNLPPIKGNLQFENISFRYQADAQEVLRDLSFEIGAGEVVGIVGRSGSGKSTLTKLLQRLYAPERGRVMVDGFDIALVDPSMPLERVMQAALLAGAHEFILELPHGYDTIVEERGANLSGGQRQRIAIARALVTNPRILIFDEATSALDYESERVIQNNMRAICRGRTVLIVAHRLSTVRAADRILVMERGQLAEAGTHDVLVHHNGLYANLVRQAAG
jgi:ATP-binding cassette, subfamily B, bacterial HlyB/CyaB